MTVSSRVALDEECGDDKRRVLSRYDQIADQYLRIRERGFLRWLAIRDLQAIHWLLAPQQGQTLLDVGCGAGLHSRALAAAGLRVVALDLAPRMVALIRPHVDAALVGDLDHLALGRRFDRVLCSGVLDYARSPDECLARLSNHVAPGGRLVVMAPRESLGGYCYRWVYNATKRIRPHLFCGDRLDELARRSGLVPIGRCHPFLHSLVIGWRRAS
jgi:2-polyprenyl-3-methyl-5-hydroxy-6-metoxy-1,4-benzoquinol methylase